MSFVCHFCLGWLINDLSTFIESLSAIAPNFFSQSYLTLVCMRSWPFWQEYKMGKSGPYVSTVSVSEKCLLLLFKSTRNRYECNFAREVTLSTFRIHSEVHIFVRFWKFWKFKYSRLQGHVTSRWFGGRQIFNLGWQKWWQRHIRFLIMVELTQKPSFGRKRHKFCWNFAFSTWRMSVDYDFLGLPSGLYSIMWSSLTKDSYVGDGCRGRFMLVKILRY